MNRCPNCAAQNRVGAKFCTSCGFRLPADSPSPASSTRSPFATTSAAAPDNDELAESPVAASNGEDERGFAPWTAPTESDETGPGLSWDSTPPQDTSVPVSDEMIASLVGTDSVVEPVLADAETDAVIELPAEVDLAITDDVETESQDVYEAPAANEQPVSETPVPTIDHLLRLTRELEYGLVELADAAPSNQFGAGAGLDSQLLANVLADLQTDDDLSQLRNAIQTAQERPRDVDVMLGLVLHADAMASILTERDQLKHAIELAIKGSNGADADPVRDLDSSPDDATSETDDSIAL